jgi:hypothetical protein
MLLNAPETHDILKVHRSFESRDANRQPLPDSKVAGLPGHFLVHPDQTPRDASDRSLFSAAC